NGKQLPRHVVWSLRGTPRQSALTYMLGLIASSGRSTSFLEPWENLNVVLNPLKLYERAMGTFDLEAPKIIQNSVLRVRISASQCPEKTLRADQKYFFVRLRQRLRIGRIVRGFARLGGGPLK
ncbi:MAG: hypothetical protein KDI56_17405, partial [Xanthomonadales bacterium]|nr:hypothetical protein [Xanthomonadales bacterium]